MRLCRSGIGEYCAKGLNGDRKQTFASSCWYMKQRGLPGKDCGRQNAADDRCKEALCDLESLKVCGRTVVGCFAQIVQLLATPVPRNPKYGGRRWVVEKDPEPDKGGRNELCTLFLSLPTQGLKELADKKKRSRKIK